MLKKLKILILSVISVLMAGFFAGCKSVPVENPVTALDLLDDKSAFYIAIPSSADPALIVRFLQNNIKNLPQKEAELIASRIDSVYCGLNHHKNKTEIQITSDARFGNSLASKVFTKKSGWEIAQVSTAKNQYSVYSQNKMDISFPSDTIAVLGRDVPELLKEYDLLKDFWGNNSAAGVTKSHLLDDELYNYLNGAVDEEEIRFYAGKPQSFLTLLTGANLNLQLESVSGSFICDKKYPKQYILNLDFKFKNETFLKAGKGLLTLAFGLTNSNSEIIGNDELVIKGILISRESLYKILVF